VLQRIDDHLATGGGLAPASFARDYGIQTLLNIIERCDFFLIAERFKFRSQKINLGRRPGRRAIQQRSGGFAVSPKIAKAIKLLAAKNTEVLEE
jgi:hypothetical protein